MERNRAIRTGDTTGIRALSTGDCQCVAFAANIEKLWKQGSVDCPIYYVVRRVAAPRITSATTGFATVVYTRNAAKYRDSQGKVTQSFAADRATQSSSLDFVKLSGIWKVSLVAVN